MKKNLISIYQSCNSNNTSIEFLPTSFHVKHQCKGTILLKGQIKDDMHEWPISFIKFTSLVAFSSVKTTSSQWHSQLGHSLLNILKHIVSTFSLPISSQLSQTSSCNACN